MKLEVTFGFNLFVWIFLKGHDYGSTPDSIRTKYYDSWKDMVDSYYFSDLQSFNTSTGPMYLKTMRKL